MATWVQAGNRKLNLDRAVWIDRGDDGDVHVVFDGALTHTFRGPAADAVWAMVAADDADPLVGKSSVPIAKSTRARASAKR
jgi:hypothetical protein